jgi:hypothetical protein
MSTTTDFTGEQQPTTPVDPEHAQNTTALNDEHKDENKDENNEHVHTDECMPPACGN